MEQEMQKVVVTLNLHVPVEMDLPRDEKGNVMWGREFCVRDYIEHWLNEGYYTEDGVVQLPDGIEFVDSDLKFGKKFMKEVGDEWAEEEAWLEEKAKAE